MKLWLLRHARVVLEPGLCYGASDVPADVGRTQEAAAAAASMLPSGLPVWVSGLARAQQLANELSERRPDLKTSVVDKRLNEMNFGQWELQAWNAIPRAAFDVWMSDFAHHRFGGAESVQQLIHRVAAAWTSLQHSRVEEAVWITHAGVIRAAQFLAVQGHTAIQGVDQWPKEAPETGGYLVLNDIGSLAVYP